MKRGGNWLSNISTLVDGFLSDAALDILYDESDSSNIEDDDSVLESNVIKVQLNFSSTLMTQGEKYTTTCYITKRLWLHYT